MELAPALLEQDDDIEGKRQRLVQRRTRQGTERPFPPLLETPQAGGESTTQNLGGVRRDFY